MTLARRWSRLLAVAGGLPLMLGAVPPAATGPAPATGVQGLENGILAELNRLRADPAGYARKLGEFRRYYRQNVVQVPGSDTFYQTEEGVAPLEGAISYLRAQSAQPEYRPSPLLALAASSHVREQAASGLVGHAGTDGSKPGDRVTRLGGGPYVAEVITYGSTTPADVVRQLVVDDGVPDRGHRLILFAGDFGYAGVFCGPHPVYHETCVVDLARTPNGRARISGGQQVAMR